MFKEFSIDFPEEKVWKLESEGKTVVLVGNEKQAIGMIAVVDRIRDTAIKSVDELRRNGIRTEMLTGDNERTARATARKISVDEYHAELLPADKLGLIWQHLAEDYGHVAMVGDGVNDAPALAQADIGIAVGSGTDVAMETGDIVLVKNDLRDVVTSIQLSRATMSKIKQGLFWAFAYNTALIPIAAGILFPFFGVLLDPVFGAAAMAFSSVSVVTNASLLRRFKPKLE